MMKSVLLAGTTVALGMVCAGKHTKDGDDKCRVLSMRGGGVHGIWEVGVLQAM